MHGTQSNLVSIGQGLYLISPAVTLKLETDTIPSASPSVILIFGWMGAKLPHLLKYSNVYDELYPSATKFIIRSEASFFWKSEKRKKADLAPVVEVLEALGCLEPPKVTKPIDGQPLEPSVAKSVPRTLVHAFSNGGAWQLSTLSSILNERMKDASFSGTVLPPSAVILDSCPGEGGIKATQKAFLTAIRNPLLKFVGSLAITFMIYFARAMQFFFRLESPIVTMRKALLKHDILPWTGKHTPRLYIYSKADELIFVDEVEVHANEAKKSGLEVTLVKYDNSPHVAHARTDPDRYWGAVKQLWSDVSIRK